MQYQKKAILLRSKENHPRLAILNLEQKGNELLYGVSQWIDCMKECRIYLFFHESRWAALEGLEGKIQMGFALQQIRAAAVVYDKGEFALRMAGEVDLDFDWNRTIAMIRTGQARPKPGEVKEEKQRAAAKEEQEELKPAFTPEEKMREADTGDNSGQKKQTDPLGSYQPILSQNQELRTPDIGIETWEQPRPSLQGGPYKDDMTQEPVHNQLPNVSDTVDIPQKIWEKDKNKEQKETPFVPPAVRAQTTCTERREAIQIMPFPDVFPESCWYKVDFPFMSGNWHYISGEIYKNGILTAYATGVPGEYSLAPPRWLTGFQTYLNAQAGAKGYWLMFEDDQGNPITLPELTNQAEA